jgi:hypothetical protein
MPKKIELKFKDIILLKNYIKNEIPINTSKLVIFIKFNYEKDIVYHYLINEFYIDKEIFNNIDTQFNYFKETYIDSNYFIDYLQLNIILIKDLNNN